MAAGADSARPFTKPLTALRESHPLNTVLRHDRIVIDYVTSLG